jgi:mannosyltransferase OCH1-like enzyme
MKNEIDIFDDFLIDSDFDEQFYQDYYPEVTNYCLSTASQIADRKRLFHHYLLHGKDRCKNISELERLLLGKIIEVDENFDEDIYEKIVPHVSSYLLPAGRPLSKRKRFFHHYVTHKNKQTIYLPVRKRQNPKLKNESRSELKINCKILIKIPSFNRLNNLIQCLKNFHDNAFNINDICFCISCNADDLSMNNDLAIKTIKQFPNTYIFFNQHQNKIDAYNADIDKFNFEVLIAASDDMEVVSKNFDQTINSLMKQHFPENDGVLWFDTGENDKTDTLSICGKKYFDKFGYVYNSGYQAYYCDDEFTHVAFKLGKLVRINMKIIRHNLPNTIEMTKDVTYLKSVVFGTRDQALYKIRKNLQFDIPGSSYFASTLQFDFPKDFFKEQRDINNTRWPICHHKFDDPLSFTELYILEEMDKQVTNMNVHHFLSFAKNYFRNFRLMIPPIIHQIWLGDMPPEIRDMMETFSHNYTQKYPGWRYILWDEKRLKHLDMINKDIFEKEPKYDSKSDIARLEILNRFGGWYLDSDFIWLGNNSLSELTAQIKKGFAIAYEKTGEVIGSGYLKDNTTRVANTILGSTIANPIIAFIIGQLKHSYPLNCERGAVACTGPDFIQTVLGQIARDLDINIIDHNYFFPVWWCTDKNRNKDFDEHKINLSLNAEELKRKYPQTIAYHMGFTSKQ